MIFVTGFHVTNFNTVINRLNKSLKIFLVALTILLVGCQSTETIYKPSDKLAVQNLYADHLFSDYQTHQLETEHEIFSLTPEMVSLIHSQVSSNRSLNQKVFDLLNLIFDEQQIGLAYKNSANLTASQTFKNREANCISLTIMAYALAKEAKLDVYFQDVRVPEYWIRNGKYSLLAGHVNLVVSPAKISHFEYMFQDQKLLIDFDPYIRKNKFKAKRISKQTIVAMFYTNVAAEALIEKNYSLAYAYLKKATQLDPYYSPAWGNLGILYKYTGELDLAVSTYEHAINLNNENFTAITNLAILFKKVGRVKDAISIQNKLHLLRSKNPYYHAMLAQSSLFAGDVNSAISLYKKAIKLDGKQHEFHYGLAKAYAANNNNLLAQKAIKKAIKLNKYPDVNNQYLAKLNLLR